MPNQKRAGLKLVGYFATDEEKAALKALAIAEGHRTVAQLLRHIALTQIAKDKNGAGTRFNVTPTMPDAFNQRVAEEEVQFNSGAKSSVKMKKK
jgi:hypothetical protein